MLTQKYKQQQQQVRVLTNESNYLKGMCFSDAPLAEGYSRVLINFDIDALSGKLRSRRGLQSLGVIKPESAARQYLNNISGFNIIAASKVCAASDTEDPRKINRYLQTVLYNTDTRSLLTVTCDSDITPETRFKANAFVLNSANEFITPEPYVIDNPGVHNKMCVHNQFFKRPVGTFAFENGFYTFLKRARYTAKKITDLPNDDYVDYAGNKIENYMALIDSRYFMGTPGEYFVFTSGESNGVIACHDKSGKLTLWEHGEEALKEAWILQDPDAPHVLCYTKLGSEILKAGDTLLDSNILKSDIEPDKYYVCKITPQQLNPTEASSWGYNMLLTDPYAFECENTAVNLVTILGILPYDNAGKVLLTPRKNQQVTLKGYYRAPEAYYSDAQNPRFYATTKKKIDFTETITRVKTYEDNTYRIKEDSVTIVQRGYVTVGSITTQAYYYYDNNVLNIVEENRLETEEINQISQRDPKDISELNRYVTDYTSYNFGDWWYCSDEKQYYMVMPDTNLSSKRLALFGTTQPAASVSLGLQSTGTENEIRVKWEMRSSGAATWTELSNTTFKLSDYYKSHGDRAPFTYTGPMPADEVLIKLTIYDITDTASGEEFVLSTNTIGLSLVSDELANTLNLDAKNYDLGQCTGMCEWEQRLVLWGVPGALNTLFVSDVNNPTFFPYPNNVDIFPDPIIAVHKYGNELLVLTTSALYRLTWDTEGTGWSHTLVQQNLHVTEADTYMSCVIKNMFFFKSGEYYYMMVPKASSSSVRGEVTIAPISKIIANLLDNFHEEVYNIIKVITNQNDLSDFTEKLVNYFSYVDNTKVVVNYVYALDTTDSTTTVQNPINSKYLYVQLIYDTDARTWCMRVFEAAHMLYASHADAIQQDRFIDITPALDADKLVLQYYKFTGLNDRTVQYVDTTGNLQNAIKIIKNYQYIDTGNRDINTELKKRFREFQFKLKNISDTNLGFFTSFLIDGSVRKDLQRYASRILVDSNPNNENTLIVEKVLSLNNSFQNAEAFMPTVLTDEDNPDCWVLDQSAFPGKTLWKIRMPISGKGLAPRVILLSTNEADYELLGHAWAYRTMNGR